jgi:hypothetical protein
MGYPCVCRLIPGIALMQGAGGIQVDNPMVMRNRAYARLSNRVLKSDEFHGKVAENGEP